MSLSEIRVHIDELDQEIQKLFLKRMNLSEQVVSAKAETGDKIFKPDREKDIISRNSQNVSPEFVKEYQAFIKRFMEVSRKYQYGRMLELRDCFPFAYSTNPEDLDPHAESALLHEKQTTYEDDFYQNLMDHSLFINSCVLIQEDGGAEDQYQKQVTYSKNLVVLPEHNRFKIMFTTPNHVSALSTILTMISDYTVNATEIYSRPVKKNGTWDYEFYLELVGNMDSPEMHSLLFQISEETTTFKILGSYYYEREV